MSRLDELIQRGKKDPTVERMEGLSTFYKNLFSARVLNGQTYQNAEAWKMLSDPGLSRMVTCKMPNGETWSSVKVDMFNRIGLMCRILENYIDEKGLYNQYPFTLLTFDIHDFNGYNFGLEQETRKHDGGDYMINTIAHQIKIASSEFLEYTKNKFDLIAFSDSYNLSNTATIPVNIVPARYGGDEFVLLVEGSISRHDLDLLTDHLKSKIGEVSGYYIDANGNIGERNARLKGDNINTFEMPESLTEQQIFIQFLKNNTLLDPSELKQIMIDFGDETPPLISEVKSIYPPQIESNIDKLNWITSGNANYSGTIKNIEILDKHFDNQEHSDKALQFFARTMYPDIFQYKMLPYADYISEISRGSYDAIGVFDVGFLKEINSNFNLVRGDMMLQSFFRQILNCFEKLGLEDMDFSRKGGTFFVGLKNSGTSSLAKLMYSNKKMIEKGLKFEYKGESVTLPCGSAYRISRRDELRVLRKRTNISNNQYKQSNTMVSDKRSEAEMTRYQNMCKLLVKDQDELRRVIALLKQKMDIENRENYVQKIAPSLSKGQFWVDSLTGSDPFYEMYQEVPDDADIDFETDVRYIKNIIPGRYVDRCQTIKTILSELPVSDYLYQLDDIAELIEVLDKTITIMMHTENTQIS
jgi:GGDEF domain-containing protein